jgi:branched-chain amino acid transport system permease protein
MANAAPASASAVKRPWGERPWTLVALCIGVLALALLPTLAAEWQAPALIALATRALIYAIAAVSLNFILGYGGLISFGHAAYFGLGGYTVGILYAHFASGEAFLGFIPGSNQLAVTLLAAVLISGVAAAGLGALSLRTTGVQFIMITLAFAQMIYFVFVSLKFYGGDDGLIVRRRNVFFDFDMRDNRTFYYIVLVLFLAYLGLTARLVRSRFGVVLQAIRQNERRVAAIGVPPYRYKLAAFVIAGMGAGMAGALMVNQARFVSPDMLHWTKSGDLMIMVILGGVGTLFGPVFGAIALVGLEDLLTQWTEHWKFILGPMLVVFVMYARGGLSGGLSGVLALFRRRGND